MQANHLPTVFIEHVQPGFSAIVADDHGGGRLAAKHLAGLGHRRCGFVYFDEQPAYSIHPEESRLAGYREALAEAHYFGGYFSGSLRWSSDYCWSGQRFSHVFNPKPSIPERTQIPASSGSKVDRTGVPIPAHGDWFVTPPLMCYAAEIVADWVSLGFEAKPGENTFNDRIIEAGGWNTNRWTG